LTQLFEPFDVRCLAVRTRRDRHGGTHRGRLVMKESTINPQI
jgi:hypothetical protein